MVDVRQRSTTSFDWIVYPEDDGATSTSPVSPIENSTATLHVAARSNSIPTSLRIYNPNHYLTVLSKEQLGSHGLKAVAYETAQFLVPIDAPDLKDQHPSSEWLSGLRARINELDQMAQEEGLPFNQASAGAALAFVQQINAGVRPGVFLIGNGNIRLVWEDEKGEQIGLQFVAQKMIQYVLFARRQENMSENIGVDDNNAVMRFVTAAGLRHLLAA